MILIFGTHRFAPRPAGERDATCRSCDETVTAVRESTFDMIHLFWIPLIPLGRHERWRCPSCGADPFAPIQSRFIRVVLVCIVLATAAWSWVAHPSKIDETSLWIIRGLLTLIFLGVLYWAAKPFDADPNEEPTAP